MDSSPHHDPIYRSSAFTLWPDRVVQGDRTARAISAWELESNDPNAAPSVSRRLIVDTSRASPSVDSDFPLLDTLYRMSLEELQQNIRLDGALDAGARWPGVWTRDVSYSILLSLAAIAPDAAKASLLQKVRRGRIVQDTGTGGSWPVSTDRVTWALAAWEIFLTTGDRAWLEQAYRIIRKSVLDDEQAAFNPLTGLFHGETSFLDWREQTYPAWMEPADIFQSHALSTNVVYFRVYRILQEMADALSLPEARWAHAAERLRLAIHRHLWLPDQQIYGQYSYGPTSATVSPRTDTLGNALAILFGVADEVQQRVLMRHQPLQAFGVPTVYPQEPGREPYHNNSVWPFVQAFWVLAAARQKHAAGVLHGIAALTRAAALFQTNKENFVLSTGGEQGTAVNSDRQLWSIAGMLAITYRVLFGLHYKPDGLHLQPFVPEPLGGTRRLSRFPYRESLLSLEVQGFGSRIRSVTMDGSPCQPLIPHHLKGEHSFVVELANDRSTSEPIAIVPNHVAVASPVLRKLQGKVSWQAIQGAAAYRVYVDGVPVESTSATEYPLPQDAGHALTVQVAAVSETGDSYLSAPVDAGAPPLTLIPAAQEGVEADPVTPYPFVLATAARAAPIVFTGNIPEDGLYRLTLLYANGSGPIGSGDKCAMRSLYLNGARAGTVVMPQRGQDAWNDWGESSSLQLRLTTGTHCFDVRLDASDRNMNGKVNDARVAHVLLRRLRLTL